MRDLASSMIAPPVMPSTPTRARISSS